MKIKIFNWAINIRKNMSANKKKEKHIITAREWRKNNPELCREGKREYREKNKELISAYQKIYRHKNKEKIKAKYRLWREKNPNYSKEYYAKNKTLKEVTL